VSNTPKAGRRARLLARKRPSIVYQLAVVDDTDAVTELAEAKDALDRAELRLDDTAGQAVTDAEKRLAAARRAVEACYEPVTLTAMDPAAFEALVAEHPGREGKDERWNDATFPLACFRACVDTSDLSADEWAELLTTSVSQAEQVALYAVAIAANARWPSGSIPNV
jgi:hypothetical protein